MYPRYALSKSSIPSDPVLRIIALLAALLPLIHAMPLCRYVDPMIGTDGMGHTFPGACVPFGGVQLSPDTDTVPHNVRGVYQPEVYRYCAGYRYSDPTIVGFSHTHFSGTGHSDLGDILVMPTTGALRLNPGTASDPDSGYRSRFSHDTEHAEPGLYEVTLSDYGIRARLTATQRTGVHSYSFPRDSVQRIIVDLDHGIYNYDGKTLWASVRVENDTLVTGYRITNGWARTNVVHFAMSLSKPIRHYGYTDRAPVPYGGGWRRFDQYRDFPEMAGRKLVSYFEFDNADTSALTVKIALSATGTDGALRNLQAEASGRSFARIASDASRLWDEALSVFEAGGSEDQKTMFYTSLYHTMINPSVYMDVDRRYRGLDGNIHTADGFTNYTVFSLWDTYRALHPLLALINPSLASDIIGSMLAHQSHSVHGMLPIWSHMANDNWCMSGYHAVSVLADALAKGVRTDADTLLKAMIATSNVRYYGNIDDYLDLGYIPFEKSATAASTTLEYAYDDWTIHRTALAAGDSATAEIYAGRALNYRNVFDLSLHLARPRCISGGFKPDFDPLQTSGEGFIEGNSFNFSFHVPHDVPGMIEAMGGHDRFLSRLDTLFAMTLPPESYADNEDVTEECLIGGYVHGNEPSHHVPYLYAWTSQPWKAQYWLREIMNRMYRNDIHGLGGNDDCGQMSAWYIFTAMGFYPVCPGSDRYIIGAPYLPYLKLNLPSGKTLEIKAPRVSDRNRYIRKVTLNGKTIDRRYLTHSEITAGGTLEFDMAATHR